VSFNEKILSNTLIKDARATLAKHATKKWSTRDPSKLKGAVYHQSLAHNGSAAATARYHAGPNHISKDGLPGLSYTMFVEDKAVYLANDIESKTLSQGDASQPGDENEMYMAVCFGGNFSGPGYQGTEEPSPFQVETAQSLWAHLKGIFGWKNNQLFGHYDFGKPACPGHVLGAFIEKVNLDKDWSDKSVLHQIDTSTIQGRQSALKTLGYYQGDADGIWSLECKGALVMFQRAVGLTADGVWGKMSQAAINTALNK